VSAVAAERGESTVSSERSELANFAFRFDLRRRGYRLKYYCAVANPRWPRIVGRLQNGGNGEHRHAAVFRNPRRPWNGRITWRAARAVIVTAIVTAIRHCGESLFELAGRLWKDPWCALARRWGAKGG
jgi:hypothetical protein